MKKSPGERWRLATGMFAIQSNPIIRSSVGALGGARLRQCGVVLTMTAIRALLHPFVALRFRNRMIPETYTQTIVLAYALIKWSASIILAE
jgi:hypothetical protein